MFRIFKKLNFQSYPETLYQFVPHSKKEKLRKRRREKPKEASSQSS